MTATPCKSERAGSGSWPSCGWRRSCRCPRTSRNYRVTASFYNQWMRNSASTSTAPSFPTSSVACGTPSTASTPRAPCTTASLVSLCTASRTVRTSKPTIVPCLGLGWTVSKDFYAAGCSRGRGLRPISARRCARMRRACSSTALKGDGFEASPRAESMR